MTLVAWLARVPRRGPEAPLGGSPAEQQAGHPAHPSVVCREPVEDGGKLRMEMGVQCEASQAECERLVRGFDDLNQKMLKELERQRK